MHELARVQQVLSVILKKAKGKRVRKATVRLTPIHGDDEEEFRFLFEMHAKGTTAEGAELEIEFVKNRYVCGECGKKEEVPFSPIRCTKCGSADLEKRENCEVELIL